MMANSFLESENPKMRKNKVYFRIFGTAFNIILLAVFMSGCTKEVMKDQPANTTQTSLNASIAETVPANQAETVVVDPVVAVTFKSSASPAEVANSTLTLREGTIPVSGAVATSASTITFTPSADLKPDTKYTATIKSTLKSGSSDGSSEHSWSFTTGKNRQGNVLSVVAVTPSRDATNVAVDVKPTITFNRDVEHSAAKSVKITLLQGTTPVAGTVTYSDKTATFSPTNNLAANTVYTGMVAFGNKGGSYEGDDDDDDDDGESASDRDDDSDDNRNSASTFTWNFTTSGGGGGGDVTPPTVLSVVPANNAMAVATSTHPSVTFSEAMDALTINATNFTLKQGSTAVAGIVAYSGTTATFTPSAPLAANTVYTGTVTTGAKDAAGNSLASEFMWSFTTTGSGADVTPPTVLTIVPANGATSIAANSNVTATFSEAMNASTINATTFTLSQGSTAVAGSVTYSGNTATFNPTNDLAGNTVYTASITTGAMDAAGNALATTRTWSFTTMATVEVVSWATQVWPIIQSRCTPCHGSSGGLGGVNMGNYAQVSALSNSAIDNTSMYPRLGTTPAEIAIIKAWIAAGKPNN